MSSDATSRDPRAESDPIRRLEAYLAEDTVRVEQAREKLIDIGDALTALRARMHNIDLGDDPGVQVLDQGVAAPIIDRLAGNVDRVDNAMMVLEVGAGAEEANSRHERDRAQAGQVQRTLVHPSILEDEAAAMSLAARRRIGQQQRLAEDLGTEFLVLGQEATVTLSEWGRPEGPYVLIRNPALVACFAAWFEAMWSIAPHVEIQDEHADPALIRLLALGAKDELIARTLHIGLRTVRRRVAALMDRYGVSTRFQLGAALERDGRLGTGRRYTSPGGQPRQGRG